MQDVFIIDAARTAVGKFGGSLSTLSAVDLGSSVIKSLIDRNKLDLNDISEVIMGQVLTGGGGQNPARQSSINSGIPQAIPAYTINMVCGSGLKSVTLGASNIIAGESKLILAGGQESMSTAGHAINLRTGIKMGDGKLTDMMLSDGLIDAFGKYHMGITAENIAKKYNISREDQDAFALNSQQKAARAQKEGLFKDEIIPITFKTKAGDVIFDYDEYIRADTNIESLAKLKPAFDFYGTVTAGNASGLNDGAAAVILANESMVKKYNFKPLAKIKASASYGVDPAYMGEGPIYAVKKVLENANWSLDDIDLIESNEAFASQSLSVIKGLNLDPSKVNVNGGAIAIGHPIGASGARVLTSLLYQMRRQNAKRGLATLCIGGGMGIALCIENI